MYALIALFSITILATGAFADKHELDEVKKALKHKKARWTSGETSVSRLTKHERKRRLGSQRPEVTGKERVLALPSVILPDKLDWRNYNGYNYVTPVREQDSCGACWAFAPTGALESNILISGNTPDIDLDLSEQTLISCGFSGSCDGGYIDAASDFISTVGLPLESCYPFGAEDGFCSSACSDWMENTYKMNGWFKVNPTVESIKYALYNLGPLVTIITAQTDFFYYKEGIYSHSWGNFEGYHSALIVGYDDIDQCFIVKSSWGTDWGEEGFSRIAYSEVDSETQFGLWTIAYETAFPADFSTIDNIARNTDVESIQNDNNEESIKSAAISGIVRDQSGNPVSNAKIRINKYTVSTDSSGRYSISSIPADSYIIIVKKPGYSTVVENISLTQNTIITKDFVMLSSSSGEAEDDDPAEPEDPEWEDDPEGGGDLGVLGPGWHNVTGMDITPKEAQLYLADRRKKVLATKSAMMPMSGAAADINSDLQELARGLRNDPKLIYDYVHNNIDYVPYYGSRKGAYLTYMDGSGNDFDQASLMIALLRAAGYTAQYVYGQMTIPGTQIANWFGVDMTKTTIHNVLVAGGIPHPPTSPLTNGETKLDRVWVKATIDGADYLFDPAFKSYAYQSKIDLGAAMGYNQSALLSSAGGTLGDNDYSIQNMNEGNLRSQLATYAGNLADFIRDQHPNADLSQIISGRNIVQTNMADYQTILPFSPVITADWPKNDIPIEMTSQLSIGFCSKPCLTTEVWPENCNCNQDNSEIFTMINTSDLGGKRITLAFESTGVAKLCVEGGNCLTGSSTTPDYMYLKIKIDHPLTGFDQRVRYNVKRGSGYSNKYAIVYNFGGVSDTLLRKRQEKLDAYKDQGLADTTEAVRGETLNIMGQTWLKEVAMTNNILSSLAETVGLVHHNIGLMCQEEGYFIDVKVALFSGASKHYPSTDNKGHFLNSALLGSAFEHGMLEQLTGSDKPAASTIKLLQIANAGGGKIFYVNSTSKDSILGTATDCSDTQLTGYTCSNITSFKSSAGGSHTFILPANGQLELNEWKGKGYIDKTSSSMGMIIGGNYFGGYNSYRGEVNTAIVRFNNLVKTYSAPAPVNIQKLMTTVKTTVSKDPVDMAGGALLNDHTDLALGGGAPLGLAFSRSYTSSKNTVKRSMGYGWTHNYDIYLDTMSHSEPVFGSRQPVEAVSLIAAIYSTLDLLRTQDNIQSWMTASLATKWAVDQMIDNAITINLGSKVMEYVKLPDGTYSAPPGITTKLINNGSIYSLQERFGTSMNFNSDKKLSEIQDIDNNTMTFIYNTDKNLTSVRDAFNRTLTINYSSGRISSVSDSSSPTRAVSYGYDGSNNLTSSTDPEGKIWGYGYNTDHRMTTLINPLAITTATNIYDTEGRVMTQRVPRQGGGTADYSFYFSGYRNQEVDPDGNALTYYYDAKGREYAQEDPLGNKFTKTFDGQDHVIKTVDPKGNISEFEYDGNQNLIRTKSPLSGAEYDMEFDYDALFRKTDAWYALNSVRQKKISHLDYDAEHHPIMATSYPESGKEISTSTTPYPNGFPNTVTDGRGVITTITYDAAGNPNTTKVSAEPVIDYDYDSVGRMVQLTDQAGAVTRFAFDRRGLLLSKTDPLGKSTTLTYYNDGSLHTKTDRNNNTITLSYTPSGNPKTITYPDTSTVNFTYNQLDNLESIQDATGITAYSYDAANRLASKTDSYGFTILYNYDEAGNLITLTYPGNKTVSYTYDELNRMKTVTIDWLNQTATYNYDAAGRLESVTNFNGTTSTYSYDDANRLTSLENRNSGGAVIATYQFELDANGNRTNTTQDEPLISTGEVGNANYTYNTQKNRLLSDGANSFGYDDEGQLNNKGGTSYTFDYEHRLTAIGNSYQFIYDAAGNRIKAVRTGVETRYIYDAGGNLLAEADGNNVITRYYVYGQGLMAMVNPANQAYCYHYNATGGTIAVTDGSQNIVNKYAYDPFGNVAGQVEATGLTQPFKYVGQFGVMAEPNGFYYMRARYYDPQVGRFISEDPIGFEGGDVNLMAYVLNNPIMGIDPTGLCYLDNYNQNLSATNKFFFQGITSVTKTAVGLITSGSVANTLGTVTPLQAIASIPNGGLATLGRVGTAVSAIANSVANAVVSGVALEAGISVGSLVNATPVYGTNQTIGEWWVDAAWNYFHKSR